MPDDIQSLSGSLPSFPLSEMGAISTTELSLQNLTFTKAKPFGAVHLLLLPGIMPISSTGSEKQTMEVRLYTVAATMHRCFLLETSENAIFWLLPAGFGCAFRRSSQLPPRNSTQFCSSRSVDFVCIDQPFASDVDCLGWFWFCYVGNQRINLCNYSQNLACIFRLKSMTLWNLPTASQVAFGPLESPEEDIVNALGNFTSLLWSFNMQR